MDYVREDPWCLTLSEDMMDERDFKSEEAIELDMSIELPKHFSLGEWLYSTNYQNWRGSCTANSTCHGIQILAVRNNWKKPEKDNIITPFWENLWTDMGHNLNDKNDSWDYVEKAVSTAKKNGVMAIEWFLVKFDGYCYGCWSSDDVAIDLMKRYLYNENPIVWCLRGNQTTRNEISAGEIKTIIPANKRTWGHAVCLVGRDEYWLWFANSRKPNDWKGLKSRFFVSYDVIKRAWGMFNRRYWILYLIWDAKKSPEYLKRKNIAVAVLKWLKKIYPDERQDVKEWIVALSQMLRKEYKEIDEELPLNS